MAYHIKLLSSASGQSELKEVAVLYRTKFQVLFGWQWAKIHTIGSCLLSHCSQVFRLLLLSLFVSSEKGSCTPLLVAMALPLL